MSRVDETEWRSAFEAALEAFDPLRVAQDVGVVGDLGYKTALRLLGWDEAEKGWACEDPLTGARFVHRKIAIAHDIKKAVFVRRGRGLPLTVDDLPFEPQLRSWARGLLGEPRNSGKGAGT